VDERRPSLVRLPWLAFAAAGLQVAAGARPVAGSALAEPAVLVSHVAVAAWLVLNAIHREKWLRLAIVTAAVGWSLNLAVMLPNGDMPVLLSAVERAHGGVVDVSDGYLAKHRVLTDATKLPWLADIHPLPALHLVYSAGDVVLALGIAGAGLVLLRNRGRAQLVGAGDRPHDGP
jgi:hypothetical protein